MYQVQQIIPYATLELIRIKRIKLNVSFVRQVLIILSLDQLINPLVSRHHQDFIPPYQVRPLLSPVNQAHL